MDYLVKWSTGGISKFIMQSLFFVIRIFSQVVNSCLFDACFNRTCLWSIVCFYFHIFAAMLIFLFLHFFIFLKFPNLFLFFLYISSHNPCNWSDKLLIYFLEECCLSSWNSKDFLIENLFCCVITMLWCLKILLNLLCAHGW